MAKKSIHTSCQRAIIQLLESIQGKYSKWELWQDFIIMSAVSIANAVNTLHREQREQLYLDRAKKYSESELGVFAQMLKEAIEEIERNPEQDLLGELFMALGLSNEWKGQFFTPYHICQMMAAIMLSTDSNDAFAKKGLYIISSYSVTRAMNPTCLIERYNEGWVTVLRADMESPSVKAPPDYSLIVA